MSADGSVGDTRLRRRHNPARRLEWAARIALVFVIVYGAIAITGRAHERFPFFAWDLFTKVPKPHKGDYDVRILSADGLGQKPVPIYFEDAKLQPPGQLVQGYVTLQRVGKLLYTHQTPQGDALRKEFESVYFVHLSHVHYQVVLRRYDIRTRVVCRTCYDDVEVLGEYTTP